ncbi:Tn3 family transposase, partial [Enterobacter hormaechei]
GYAASGLHLVTAALVLWHTVYLEGGAHALRRNAHAVDDSLVQYLSPLGWEHFTLTGDYVWPVSYKNLTLPTKAVECRCRWSPYL